MLNKDNAVKIISDILRKMEVKVGLQLEINYEYYEEFDDYMIFAYNSTEYLRTHNNSSLLAGNLPLIVDKVKGDVYILLNEECDLEKFTVNQLLKNGFIEIFEL